MISGVVSVAGSFTAVALESATAPSVSTRDRVAVEAASVMIESTFMPRTSVLLRVCVRRCVVVALRHAGEDGDRRVGVDGDPGGAVERGP